MEEGELGAGDALEIVQPSLALRDGRVGARAYLADHSLIPRLLEADALAAGGDWAADQLLRATFRMMRHTRIRPSPGRAVIPKGALSRDRSYTLRQ